jgi:ABC-2 type transport system ATP-binding protein
MGKPMIAVEGVDRRFGTKVVLKDVSMLVHPGEIVGLLGPSGAGKTTLVRMIAGADEPDRGEVVVDGKRMPNLEALEQIGYMAQSDALYLELPGRENMEFFGALAGLSGSDLARSVERAATVVGLTNDLDRPVLQYSGGMKRRLSLAIAILHEPRVLLLDEPTVGIDPVLRLSIWDELLKYAKAGASILVTTHVMDEAERCTSVAMVRDGNMIARGTPDELKKQTGKTTMEGCFLWFGGVR